MVSNGETGLTAEMKKFQLPPERERTKVSNDEARLIAEIEYENAQDFPGWQPMVTREEWILRRSREIETNGATLNELELMRREPRPSKQRNEYLVP